MAFYLLRQPPGKSKQIRHKVLVSNGPLADSIAEQFIFPAGNLIQATAQADGSAGIVGAANAIRDAVGAVAASSTATARGLYAFRGEADGASTLVGDARVLTCASGRADSTSAVGGTAGLLRSGSGTATVQSTASGTLQQLTVAYGTIEGTSAISGLAGLMARGTGEVSGASTAQGTAIRRAVASGWLAGSSTAEADGTRIAWASGTADGEAIAAGVPTTRIFAPSWGYNSVTGNVQISYQVSAAGASASVAEGLAGHLILAKGESFGGESAASATQRANLKTAGAAGESSSGVEAVADVLADAVAETPGAGDAEADTEVVFLAEAISATDTEFDEDGKRVSTTVAAPTAITHGKAVAASSSHMKGSAPTPVAATGTIEASGALEYVEIVIWDAEYLAGYADLVASAGAKMTIEALSVNLSHARATANFGPALLAAIVSGRNRTGALATVAWNERPPR